MKEYKLLAWPDLPASYQRAPFRRMVNDMSNRHVTLAQLVTTSGLTRQAVLEFISLLSARHLIDSREAVADPVTPDILKPKSKTKPKVGGKPVAKNAFREWLRKAFAGHQYYS